MQKEEVLKTDFDGLARKLGSSRDGLSSKAAEERLAHYGLNEFKKEKINALIVLGRQFRSSLIYLLIAASAISYGIGDYSGGTVIFAILLINTLLGFFQEYRSEKMMEKLSQFMTTAIGVKRDGEFTLVGHSKIVPGDVITVREGDIVPADIRLFETVDLQVNESQLTGESIPVSKRGGAGVTAEDCLLYSGSVIEKGEAQGIVYATGKDTELGTIAKLSTQTKRVTQYEKSLQVFSSSLMKITLLGLGLVFAAKVLLVLANHGALPVADLLLFVIATAVAVIPEALPVIATVTLSNGAMKLAKRHVVVKRLSSIEDLGNVNMLCTDKTGTLTENKMVISRIVSKDSDLFQRFAYASVIPLKTKKHRLQNTYDEAFDKYVSETIKREAKKLEVVKELPFDPEARRSRTVLKDTQTGKYYLVAAGAPEQLLDITDDSRSKAKYLSEIIAEGKQGLHLLAMAYKEITYSGQTDVLKEGKDMIFLGYASMHDPLRSSVKTTIQLAEKLGVKIKILTGDSREVAEYIGKEVGLVSADSQVYVGDELAKMDDDRFDAVVEKCNVFARVLPAQKFRIIESLKKNNVVAYQGDGINDAPSLKLADVAIAVNSATDIAKESSDMVLLNKSLEVIVNGIDYGRSIFVNINKYIKHTMVSNFGNFIALSVLYLVSVSLPLLPVQILLTSVITDIPLITVYSDAVEREDVVRPEKQSVKELLFISLIMGVPTALFEIFYFLLIRTQSQMVIQTSLYLFLTLIALVVFYVVRSRKTLFGTKPPSTLINISFVLAAVVSIALIYIPTFQSWFYFMPLGAYAIGMMILFTVLYLFVTGYVKTLYYRYAARS
ncbi:MAG: cation-transporting P-type ATPase [Patescibacteria group bacterium]|nr:cation-transporting P-type ATPase [Patescibacteria group bacterium]MCL5224222.1 cation-transporting P-type ATPase [Patescibacteria group bacterium]